MYQIVVIPHNGHGEDIYVPVGGTKTYLSRREAVVDYDRLGRPEEFAGARLIETEKEVTSVGVITAGLHPYDLMFGLEV